MKRDIKFRKSQILIFGSLLIFVGIMVLSMGHLQSLKEEVFEMIRLSFLDNKIDSVDEVTDANEVTNLGESTTEIPSDNNTSNNNNSSNNSIKYKYDYIGYLEIPKIRLKRGFLNKESKYNDISYNVAVSYDADYPDVVNGNFILLAHSGDAYISFFAYLYKLKLGDFAYVTYKGNKYKYKLVKIEVQPKVGVIAIHRPNYQTKGLTLITCTKDDDYTQTIYIFEIV